MLILFWSLFWFVLSFACGLFLKVLYLSHPKRFIRDTSMYKPFTEMNNVSIDEWWLVIVQVDWYQSPKGMYGLFQEINADFLGPFFSL